VLADVNVELSFVINSEIEPSEMELIAIGCQE
jgi:hypothetical protein